MSAAEGVLRAFAVARAAWAAEREKPEQPQRRRDELQFLPAAVEVMETPASPAGRATAWTIMALFALALVWASIAEIEVVAMAQGKVVPTGRSKLVQPLEAGIVRAIHVEDGKAVRAGDVLIELDPTQTSADRERLTADLMASRMEGARLMAALADYPERAFVAPPAMHRTLVEMHRALMIAQVEEQRAKLASLDSEIARKGSERAGIQANIVRIEKVLPLVRERAEARTGLAERGFFSRLQALEIQQQVIEQEQELTVLRHRRDEVASAIGALDRQRRQAEAEFRKNRLVELAEVEKRVSALNQELLKADRKSEQQTLVAPIDGVVQQLAVNTVGGVVTPAQALMVIVPRDERLEIEATILNRDIGFVEAGQEVAIKLETFLFTKYGTIPGRVISVSRDAVQDEKQGLVYPVRVALERASIEGKGRSMALGAGMAVTVEIKTESRRVIDYLLSPILRYRSESLRER